MTKKSVTRYSEAKIFEILKEYQSGIDIAQICRKYGVGKSTLYKWNNKYKDMELSDIKKLKSLIEENRKLKEVCANLNLDNLILKEALEKNFQGLCKLRIKIACEAFNKYKFSKRRIANIFSTSTKIFTKKILKYKAKVGNISEKLANVNAAQI